MESNPGTQLLPTLIIAIQKSMRVHVEEGGTHEQAIGKDAIPNADVLDPQLSEKVLGTSAEIRV